MTSKIRQNWEPVQRYLAFDFGTAIHAGLQVYYDPKTWHFPRKTRESMAREAFEASFHELQKQIKVGDLEFELTFNEQIKLGLGMLNFYFTWAPKQDNFVPIFVEIEFEVPIPGLEGIAVYQGRIDLVVEVFDDDGNSLGYYIVDHKTAKQFGETMWLYLDDQCSSYAWALKQMLGLDIRGVIYNQLRKEAPHPPKQLKNGSFSVNKQQNTTFETYLRTLRENEIDPHHYRDMLLYLKHNPKEFCRRTKVTFAPRALDIVEKRIVQEAREMINPDVQIYPTPSPMNCNGCRFFVPCLQTQEGGEPSMDMYERRS
jgi:PD-(D/E)XK nuclease superfamily